MSFKLTDGLDGGSRTVRVQKQTGDANEVYIDCVLNTGNASPPQVVIVMEGQLATYGGSGSDAALAAFKVGIEAVVAEAEFASYCTAIDMDDYGWSESTMLQTDDNIHPNDRGCACIADAVCEVLGRISWRQGINQLTGA